MAALALEPVREVRVRLIAGLDLVGVEEVEAISTFIVGIAMVVLFSWVGQQIVKGIA
jgi:hypothetical protein